MEESSGTRRSLIIKNIEKADKGQYTCTCGDSQITADMVVKSKFHCYNIPCSRTIVRLFRKYVVQYLKRFRCLCPAAAVRFTKKLVDMEVSGNDSVLLACELSEPNVQVTWCKNGLPIDPSDHVTASADKTKHTLSLAHVQPDDCANYSVEVGPIKSEAKLSIKGDQK